jgi:RimJ/RimL family protein N-acetyltransferase
MWLRPLTAADAPAMVAGEDDEIVRWLNGGRSTLAMTDAYLSRVATWWADDGPNYCFGIRLDDVLVGTMDAQTAQPYLSAGQVNLAYGVYAPWRGRGLAVQAVRLMLDFLAPRPGLKEAVIRTDVANPRSAAVASRAGFVWTHRSDDAHGRLDWHVRALGAG